MPQFPNKTADFGVNAPSSMLMLPDPAALSRDQLALVTQQVATWLPAALAQLSGKPNRATWYDAASNWSWVRFAEHADTLVFTTQRQRMTIELLIRAAERGAVLAEHEVGQLIKVARWRLREVFTNASGAKHPILELNLVVEVGKRTWSLAQHLLPHTKKTPRKHHNPRTAGFNARPLPR